MRSLGIRFFVHLITFFALQIIFCACMYLAVRLLRDILEKKVNLGSISIAINPEPSLDTQNFPILSFSSKVIRKWLLFKSRLDMVSFLLSDIFSFETQRKKKNKVPHKYYIINLKIFCLSPSIKTFTLYT